MKTFTTVNELHLFCHSLLPVMHIILQGLLKCLPYAYKITKPEPEYAYKRYTYKKNM